MSYLSPFLDNFNNLQLFPQILVCKNTKNSIIMYQKEKLAVIMNAEECWAGLTYS